MSTDLKHVIETIIDQYIEGRFAAHMRNHHPAPAAGTSPTFPALARIDSLESRIFGLTQSIEAQGKWLTQLESYKVGINASLHSLTVRIGELEEDKEPAEPVQVLAEQLSRLRERVERLEERYQRMADVERKVGAVVDSVHAEEEGGELIPVTTQAFDRAIVEAVKAAAPEIIDALAEEDCSALVSGDTDDLKDAVREILEDGKFEFTPRRGRI